MMICFLIIQGLFICLENIIKNDPNNKYNQETIDIILDVFIKQKKHYY